MRKKGNKSWRQITCLLTTLVATASAPAFAEPCSRPIRIGVTPVGTAVTLDAAGKIGGFYIDILEKISKSGECSFQYVALPRARAAKVFETNNEIDVLAPAVQTEERDKFADFVPTSSAPVVLITFKQKTKNPLLALEKGELAVNVVRGYDFGPKYLELVAKLRAKNVLEEVTDADIVARKIKAGRADATIMNTLAFYPAALESGLMNDVQATPIPDLGIVTTGLYLSKQNLSAADSEALKQQIRKFVNSGELMRAVKERFVGEWALTGYKPALDKK